MKLIYSNIIDDGDWFDSNILMTSFGDVKNIINGNLDESNFSISSDFTISWIKTNQTVYCDNILDVKSFKIKAGQTLTLKEGSTAFLTLES